jgi:hypothetical protein
MARTERAIAVYSRLYPPIQLSEDKKNNPTNCRAGLPQLCSRLLIRVAAVPLPALRRFRQNADRRQPTASHPSTMNRPGTLPAPAIRYSQVYPCRRYAIPRPTQENHAYTVLLPRYDHQNKNSTKPRLPPVKLRVGPVHPLACRVRSCSCSRRFRPNTPSLQYSVVRRSPDRAHTPTEGITPHHSITPPLQVPSTINHEP